MKLRKRSERLSHTSFRIRSRFLGLWQVRGGVAVSLCRLWRFGASVHWVVTTG